MIFPCFCIITFYHAKAQPPYRCRIFIYLFLSFVFSSFYAFAQVFFFIHFLFTFFGMYGILSVVFRLSRSRPDSRQFWKKG